MTSREVLISKVKTMPDVLVEKTLSLLALLEDKRPGLETYLLSESSLKKAWLTAEEDEAWKNL